MDQLVMTYRELDRDLAILYAQLNSLGQFERKLFLPTTEAKETFTATLQQLNDRIDALPALALHPLHPIPHAEPSGCGGWRFDFRHAAWVLLSVPGCAGSGRERLPACHGLFGCAFGNLWFYCRALPPVFQFQKVQQSPLEGHAALLHPHDPCYHQLIEQQRYGPVLRTGHE